MKNIVTWYGQPILNLDQRNEIEASLREQIADYKAKEREAGVFLQIHYQSQRWRLEDDLRALFRAKFVNPNEGMLL